VYILSEESRSGGAHDPHGSFFLVDPLDGTKEFLKRNGEFTVNIAWIHHGEPAAGVVLAPALNEIFFAAAGLGAWKQAGAGARQALRTNPWLDGKPVRVIGSRSHGGVALDAWLARLTLPFTFLAAGSSLKFCRIAEGQADLYPRFGPTCQWDTAAAHCVLAQAGGSVTTMDGQALVYGIERPIRNPEFLAVGNAGLLDAVRVR
jgi:3'(2'), 5'-bisphosphate nucleotidase